MRGKLTKCKTEDRRDRQLKKLWQKMNLTLKWTIMLLLFALMGRFSFVTLGGEGEDSMICSRPGHAPWPCC